MTESTMPATEVQNSSDHEVVTYELAYHILPTVAEGEVTTVEGELTALIEKAGGKITDTEAAERFELAYEIDKYLEGKYRKFTSAYFGWVRFTLATDALASVTEGVDEHKQLLRYLLVRLTKVEEVNPFRFHEALEKTQVKTIDMDAEVDVVESEEVDVDGVTDEVMVEEVKLA